MVLASALGALGSIGSSIFGGLMGANASKKAARDQFAYQSMLQAQAAQLNYDYGLKSLKNSPNAQRQGLEKAGYNPMLAVQNATSGANAGWTSAGQAQNIDYAGAISAGVANAQSIQRLKNETLSAVSNANLQNEQALTEENKRRNYDFDTMMKDAQTHMTDKQTSWIDKEKNAQIYKDMQDAERARAEASVVAYNADTARILANAQQQNVNIGQEALDIGKDKELRYKEWGKKHPILRNLDETVNRYINLNFGGSASSGSSVSHIYKH